MRATEGRIVVVSHAFKLEVILRALLGVTARCIGSRSRRVACA